MNAPHPKASDHLELNAPDGSNPFQKDKVAEINQKIALSTFDIPATLVNDFAVTFTGATVRLAAAEKDSSNIPRVRTVIAFDYESFFNLCSLVDRLRQKILADMEAANEALKSAFNEEAPDNTEKSVG